MNAVLSTALIRHFRASFAAPQLDSLARLTGFVKRLPRRIRPRNFALGCCLWALQPKPSAGVAAVLFGLLGRTTISKQAVVKRLGQPALCFLQEVLAVLVARTAKLRQMLSPQALAPFGRVLLQDSTTCRLHPSLAPFFPGSANQHDVAQAQLKIQLLYEVVHERFVQFWVTPFRVNDQQAASLPLELLQRGDLLIRDLGYFTMATLQGCRQRGAFFLSRLRLDMTLWEADSHVPLDLLARLKREGRLDLDVRLGAQTQEVVRLVAVPLSEAAANERRRKARANRDRRLNPSAKRLALLGWNILVTNVSREVWTAETVCRVYGLRWRIETVFKSWKSHLYLEALPRASATQVQVLLYARLLVITLLWVWLIPPPCVVGTERPLSLLKLAELFAMLFMALILEAVGDTLPELIRQQSAYHCRYEKRKRLNYLQKIALLS